MEAPIKDNKASFAGKSNDLSAMTGTVLFNGDKMEGNLVAYASLFSGTKSPPNDAEAKSCKTRDLTFKAKLVNPIP